MTGLPRLELTDNGDKNNDYIVFRYQGISNKGSNSKSVKKTVTKKQRKIVSRKKQKTVVKKKRTRKSGFLSLF